MIGSALYSPVALGLFVNRQSYYPIIATKTNTTSVEAFLIEDSSRTKVLMVIGVELLSTLAEVHDLSKTKIIVFDTLRELSRLKVSIIDARIQKDNTIVFIEITPDQVNSELSMCDFGSKDIGDKPSIEHEDLVLRAQAVQSATPGELSAFISTLTNKLGEKEAASAAEEVLKCIVGIFPRRKLTTICPKYGIEEIGRIVEYMTDHGRVLREAFMDACLYKTDPLKAVEESGANVVDFQFLITILPLERNYEFTTPVVRALMKKRSAIRNV